jgi:SAM-dependent methyltransferase
MRTREILVEIAIARAFASARREWPLPKFLDVGCGVGNVMALAESFDLRVYGLQYDPRLIELAAYPKYQRGMESGWIFQEDALKYKDYGKYDILYYYCPIADREKERELERRIEEQMQLKALLIANMKNDPQIAKDSRFRRRWGDQAYGVWQKVKE